MLSKVRRKVEKDKVMQEPDQFELLMGLVEEAKENYCIDTVKALVAQCLLGQLQSTIFAEPLKQLDNKVVF